MWRCTQCGKSVDDDSDLCWNCGADAAGEPDPHFQREPEAPDDDETAEPAEAPIPGSAVVGMTRHEIATLVCKSLALALFAYAAYNAIALIGLVIVFLYSLVFDEFSWHYSGELMVYSFPALSMTVVASLYWKKAEAIASRMVGRDAQPVTLEKVTIRDMMTVIFAAMGLYTLVSGVYSISQLIYLMYLDAFESSVPDEMIWTIVVQLALGLWLMLGSRGVVNGIVRLRDAGRPRDPEVNPVD